MRSLGMICCYVVLCLASAVVDAQTRMAGEWNGAIVLPGIDLGITVHFSGPDDSLRATIDIPMQMARGLALQNTRAEFPEMHFELPAGPGLAVFDGTLAGDSITGDFRQGTVAAKFHIHRAGKAQNKAAAPPPPYREEEVTITNEGLTLAGTLSMPPNGGPFTAAILLTGSGAQNRDEEIFGFAPFKILADHLTRNGFAVLRCDDRGVGGSTGNMSTSTIVDFSHDAMAMLNFLQGRPEIRKGSIGLIGHSEGAEVAAMSAASSGDVAFVILLAGPALRGDSVILSQIRVLAQDQGESNERIAQAIALQRRVFAVVRSQTGWDELRAEMSTELRRSVDRLPAEQRAAITNMDSMVAARLDIQINAIRTPWFASFISYDPAGDLEKLRCPVLALFGELDMQVQPALHLEAARSAMKTGGNPDAEISTISSANHLFQKAGTGNPAEYATLEKKFTDGVLDRLSLWLKKRFH